MNKPNSDTSTSGPVIQQIWVGGTQLVNPNDSKIYGAANAFTSGGQTTEYWAMVEDSDNTGNPVKLSSPNGNRQWIFTQSQSVSGIDDFDTFKTWAANLIRNGDGSYGGQGSSAVVYFASYTFTWST